jgi:hypothetical protein
VVRHLQPGPPQDAQPLRLAFGGQPEPDDFGRTLADAAVLIYLGCLGLLLHSHETTPEALQVSMTAFLLYRTVRYVETVAAQCRAERPGDRPADADARLDHAGVPDAGPVCLHALPAQPPSAPCATWRHDRRRRRRHRLWLLPAQVLAPYHQQPLNAWLGWNWLQLDWPSLTSLKFLFRVGVWFFWPAWPFAGWAVWAWRRQRRAAHRGAAGLRRHRRAADLFNPQPEQASCWCCCRRWRSWPRSAC